MKLPTPRKLLLPAALAFALPLSATPEVNTMTPKVTGHFQESEVMVPDGPPVRIVGKLQAVRLNAKSLLDLIGQATETEFPRGAKLQVDLGWIKSLDAAGPRGSVAGAQVFVVDRNGGVLADATPYLIFQFDFNALIFAGFIDPDGREKTRNQFPASLRILFPEREIDVTFRGNCHEVFHATAVNNEGVQRIKGSTRFKGEGSGFFDGRPFIGTANVGLRGNELVDFDQ